MIRSLSFLLVLSFCVWQFTSERVLRAEEIKTTPIRPTFLMFSDPDLTLPAHRYRLDDRLLAMWRQALKRPESELRRLVADDIAKAHRDGFPGMTEARPELLDVLTQTDTQAAVSLTAAQALITLDSRDAAESLFQTAQKRELEFKLLIEPALATWDYRPQRELWHKRLNHPQTDRRELMLAINGCGVVRDPEALTSLLEIVRSSQRPLDVRLAAARAAGAISESNLESLSDELSSSPNAPITHRLMAVSLLVRHSSEPARQQLARLGHDAEPSVAAAALGMLYSIDPALVLPLADEALQSRDANVRRHGIESFISLPTVPRIAALGKSLDDPHPTNRGRVRDELFRFAAQPEFAAAVREAGMNALTADSWRSQEQAALLLGALDHEPAAPRLVTFLESTRPEVMSATAWSLKKLAVPDTLPAILDKATRQTPTPQANFLAADLQVAHLFEAMAVMKYEAAQPLLRQYVPKNFSLGEQSRGAAIWALGQIREDKPDEELAKQLTGRMLDTNTMPTELLLIRRMSVVSIGRMKAASQLTALRNVVGPEIDLDVIEYAIRWAIQRITNEELPLAVVPELIERGWFLQPVD